MRSKADTRAADSAERDRRTGRGQRGERRKECSMHVCPVKHPRTERRPRADEARPCDARAGMEADITKIG